MGLCAATEGHVWSEPEVALYLAACSREACAVCFCLQCRRASEHYGDHKAAHAEALCWCSVSDSASLLRGIMALEILRRMSRMFKDHRLVGAYYGHNAILAGYVIRCGNGRPEKNHLHHHHQPMPSPNKQNSMFSVCCTKVQQTILMFGPHSCLRSERCRGRADWLDRPLKVSATPLGAAKKRCGALRSERCRG